VPSTTILIYRSVVGHAVCYTSLPSVFDLGARDHETDGFVAWQGRFVLTGLSLGQDSQELLLSLPSPFPITTMTAMGDVPTLSLGHLFVQDEDLVEFLTTAMAIAAPSNLVLGMTRKLRKEVK
jgi:hypothetical protein